MTSSPCSDQPSASTAPSPPSVVAEPPTRDDRAGRAVRACRGEQQLAGAARVGAQRIVALDQREPAGARHLDHRGAVGQQAPVGVDGRRPAGPLTRVVRRRPLRAASSTSSVPSPPSASGSSVAAIARPTRRPAAIAAAASAAVSEPRNLSGQQIAETTDSMIRDSSPGCNAFPPFWAVYIPYCGIAHLDKRNGSRVRFPAHALLRQRLDPVHGSPLLERFGAARERGLRRRRAVVAARGGPRPRGRDRRTRASRWSLLNFDAGDMPAGERGLISDPSARTSSAPTCRSRSSSRARWAARSSTRWPATRSSPRPRGAARAARENVRFAADAAAEQGASPHRGRQHVRERALPALAHRDAAAFVRVDGRENVRLQYDAYHMQRMEGNLTRPSSATSTASPTSRSPTARAAASPAPARSTTTTFYRPRGARLRRLRRPRVQAATQAADARRARPAWRARGARQDRIHRPGRHGRPHGAATSWRPATGWSSTAAPRRQAVRRAPTAASARARSPSAPTS